MSICQHAVNRQPNAQSTYAHSTYAHDMLAHVQHTVTLPPSTRSDPTDAFQACRSQRVSGALKPF